MYDPCLTHSFVVLLTCFRLLGDAKSRSLLVRKLFSDLHVFALQESYYYSVSKTRVLVGSFTPLLTFYMARECSSGSGTPNYGELKLRCFTLAKRWLSKYELLKLPRAPI